MKAPIILLVLLFTNVYTQSASDVAITAPESTPESTTVSSNSNVTTVTAEDKKTASAQDTRTVSAEDVKTVSAEDKKTVSAEDKKTDAPTATPVTTSPLLPSTSEPSTATPVTTSPLLPSTSEPSTATPVTTSPLLPNIIPEFQLYLKPDSSFQCLVTLKPVLTAMTTEEQKLWYKAFLSAKGSATTDKDMKNCFDREVIRNNLRSFVDTHTKTVNENITDYSKKFRTALTCVQTTLEKLHVADATKKEFSSNLMETVATQASTNQCAAVFLTQLSNVLNARKGYLLLNTVDMTNIARVSNSVISFPWTEEEMKAVVPAFIDYAHCYSALPNTYYSSVQDSYVALTEDNVCKGTTTLRFLQEEAAANVETTAAATVETTAAANVETTAADVQPATAANVKTTTETPSTTAASAENTKTASNIETTTPATSDSTVTVTTPATTVETPSTSTATNAKTEESSLKSKQNLPTTTSSAQPSTVPLSKDTPTIKPYDLKEQTSSSFQDLKLSVKTQEFLNKLINDYSQDSSYVKLISILELPNLTGVPLMRKNNLTNQILSKMNSVTGAHLKSEVQETIASKSCIGNWLYSVTLNSGSISVDCSEDVKKSCPSTENLFTNINAYKALSIFVGCDNGTRYGVTYMHSTESGYYFWEVIGTEDDGKTEIASICAIQLANFSISNTRLLQDTVVPVPLTTEPSTAAPVTTGPSTAAPVTTEPSTAAPATAEPSTAVPVTTEPSTAAPVTTEPSTAAPVTTEPSTAPPANLTSSTKCLPQTKQTCVDAFVDTCKSSGLGDALLTLAPGITGESLPLVCQLKEGDSMKGCLAWINFNLLSNSLTINYEKLYNLQATINTTTSPAITRLLQSTDDSIIVTSEDQLAKYPEAQIDSKLYTLAANSLVFDGTTSQATSPVAELANDVISGGKKNGSSYYSVSLIMVLFVFLI
jgi:hypothetical protein